MSRTPVDREVLLTTAAFAGLSVLAAAMPAHNDTWWHLRAGLETLNGHSPFTDHFSWTRAGSFYWNTSWLGQVVFAILHVAGGMPLVAAACAGAAVVGWWLVWRQCRGDVIERLVLLAVALPVSTMTWSVRPQMAIVLLPVVVALVASNRVLAASAVMALWANLHAGFVLGVIVLGAGVVAALVYERSVMPARILTLLAGVAATLVTPLGWANWREIDLSLQRSNANAIIEWRPPEFGGAYLAFWATGAMLAGLLVLRWRRLDTPYLQVSALSACVVLVSATRAVRVVPAFMMLALPALSALLFSARTPPDDRRPPVRTTRGLQLAIAAFAGTVIAWLWTHPSAAMDWHPMSANARSAIATCRPPIFNTYDQGGPIIWFVPSQPVFVDSRQDPYPVSLVQDAVRVELAGDHRRVFSSYGVNCAVLPPSSPAVTALRSDGWRQRYADERWVVLDRPGPQSSGTK
jgi:hypothetical protein